jgi:hypothetical protein
MSEPITPYRLRHKPLTANLQNDQHAEFCAIAHAKGTKPSTLAAEVFRKFITDEKAALPTDTFEPTLIYRGYENETA